MTNVLEGRDFATAGEFLVELNRARLMHRKAWITYAGTVAGRSVQVKTYDSGYLQILRVDGVEHSAPMDMKPTAWKQFILAAVGQGDSQ